jgi:uncharacterized protein YqhQ
MNSKTYVHCYPEDHAITNKNHSNHTQIRIRTMIAVLLYLLIIFFVPIFVAVLVEALQMVQELCSCFFFLYWI